jgi:hypothetical protein
VNRSKNYQAHLGGGFGSIEKSFLLPTGGFPPPQVIDNSRCLLDAIAMMGARQTEAVQMVGSLSVAECLSLSAALVHVSADDGAALLDALLLSQSTGGSLQDRLRGVQPSIFAIANARLKQDAGLEAEAALMSGFATMLKHAGQKRAREEEEEEDDEEEEEEEEDDDDEEEDEEEQEEEQDDYEVDGDQDGGEDGCEGRGEKGGGSEDTGEEESNGLGSDGLKEKGEKGETAKAKVEEVEDKDADKVKDTVEDKVKEKDANKVDVHDDDSEVECDEDGAPLEFSRREMPSPRAQSPPVPAPAPTLELAAALAVSAPAVPAVQAPAPVSAPPAASAVKATQNENAAAVVVEASAPTTVVPPSAPVPAEAKAGAPEKQFTDEQTRPETKERIQNEEEGRIEQAQQDQEGKGKNVQEEKEQEGEKGKKGKTAKAAETGQVKEATEPSQEGARMEAQRKETQRTSRSASLSSSSSAPPKAKRARKSRDNAQDVEQEKRVIEDAEQRATKELTKAKDSLAKQSKSGGECKTDKPNVGSGAAQQQSEEGLDQQRAALVESTQATMKQHGWSQAMLGREINEPQAYVSQWLRGKKLGVATFARLIEKITQISASRWASKGVHKNLEEEDAETGVTGAAEGTEGGRKRKPADGTEEELQQKKAKHGVSQEQTAKGKKQETKGQKAQLVTCQAAKEQEGQAQDGKEQEGKEQEGKEQEGKEQAKEKTEQAAKEKKRQQEEIKEQAATEKKKQQEEKKEQAAKEKKKQQEEKKEQAAKKKKKQQEEKKEQAAKEKRKDQKKEPKKGTVEKGDSVCDGKLAAEEYRGVSFHKISRVFSARIRFSGTQKHIGSFDTAEEAARAYDVAARQYHGDEARYNFPNQAKGRASAKASTKASTKASAKATARPALGSGSGAENGKEEQEQEQEQGQVQATVGDRISIYWPDEDAWFVGRIQSQAKKGTTILYEDGDEQLHQHMATERYKIIAKLPPGRKRCPSCYCAVPWRLPCCDTCEHVFKPVPGRNKNAKDPLQATKKR